jgi:hypothetical protein
MSIDKQLLKIEIEATIKEYQKALKPENLTYFYCFEKEINSGICRYALMQNYKLLYCELINIFSVKFLCNTPNSFQEYYAKYGMSIFVEKECTSILEAHQTRIDFLQNLLKEIE